ncbi:MAG: dienelactone hydrolase family protein [Rhodospirillales bacterium]
MFRLLMTAVAVLTASVFAISTARAEVQSETVTYNLDGKEFTGYMAWDDDYEGFRPGVVVVHEWWGHNDYARMRADLLAKNGYTAFALDMYGTGKLAEHPSDAKAFMMEAIEKSEQAVARFETALAILRAHPTVDPQKTAAIGYCFGGAVVLNMARAGANLDGVVSYHGNLSPMVEPTGNPIQTEVLVYTGGSDPFVPADQVAAFETEMTELGVKYELVSYPWAVHSFTNPGADEKAAKYDMPLRYDSLADGDSWIGTMNFFDRLFK